MTVVTAYVMLAMKELLVNVQILLTNVRTTEEAHAVVGESVCATIASAKIFTVNHFVRLALAVLLGVHNLGRCSSWVGVKSLTYTEFVS